MPKKNETRLYPRLKVPKSTRQEIPRMNPARMRVVNLRLAAVRRIAYEAADSGLLSPELAAGIRRVKGVRRLGVRVVNWLTAEQGKRLLESASADTLRSKRNRAMISLLIGCGLTAGRVAWVDHELHSAARGALGDFRLGWQRRPHPHGSDSSLG